MRVNGLHPESQNDGKHCFKDSHEPPPTSDHTPKSPTADTSEWFAGRWVLPVALFPSREVLHVALLFLRVISACADGKIRIYNFLNGNCLKVMKVNGRGDPVLSFFIQGNRWVVGVEVRVLSESV